MNSAQWYLLIRFMLIVAGYMYESYRVAPLGKLIVDLDRELRSLEADRIKPAMDQAQMSEREQPEFSGPTCRGSFALGSACGHCERCAREAKRAERALSRQRAEQGDYAP